MTRQEIEATEWAREVKKDSPDSYDEAIGYVMAPNLLVIIFCTNETGEIKWAIAPVIDPGFWLDAKPTKKEAVALCRKMEWEIKSGDLE